MPCVMIKEGYDLERLRREVNAFKNAEYLVHPGESTHWSGVPLRNPTGAITGVKINARTVEPCKDTAHMEQTPYIKQLLSELPAPVRIVRLLKIDAGFSLSPHQDGARYAYDGGTMCRLHLPIYTSSEVAFVIDDVGYHLEEGKLYYTDVSRMHAVHNRGTSDRVHLVIDVASTPEMLEMIKNGRRL